MARKQTENLPAIKAKTKTPFGKLKDKELEYLKDYADVPKYYVNNTLVTTNLYDVKFVFGQIITADDKKLVVDPGVLVFMSPQHAKAILPMLEKQIKAYEERNGPIPTNPEKS